MVPEFYPFYQRLRESGVLYPVGSHVPKWLPDLFLGSRVVDIFPRDRQVDTHRKGSGESCGPLLRCTPAAPYDPSFLYWVDLLRKPGEDAPLLLRLPVLDARSFSVGLDPTRAVDERVPLLEVLRSTFRVTAGVGLHRREVQRGGRVRCGVRGVGDESHPGSYPSGWGGAERSGDWVLFSRARARPCPGSA